MINKVSIAGCSLLVTSILFSGCSQVKEDVSKGKTKTGESKEPITLTFYYGSKGSLNLNDLGITEVLKTKFPHITLHFIERDGSSKPDYKDLIATGTLPDIIYDSASFTVERIIQNNFHYDLQELIKKHNFDLKKFEPHVLSQVQSNNSESKLFGLPVTLNRYGLYYNKDLFDRFGIPYPKDGMTWDDVYELAKKMTRVENGTSYIGFAMAPGVVLLNNQLSLGQLDLKEDKAALNTDGWKLLFQNLKRFYDIPDNKLVATDETSKGNVAMTLDISGKFVTWNKANPVNLDVVSIPTLNEKPGVGFKPATLALFVTQTSKHKDEAFEVVSYLVSEEIQTMLSRKGFGTPLVSAAVKKAFGQDVPEMQGKNNGAFYYHKDAPPTPPRSAELTNVNVNISKAFTDMINNKTDVITTLRQFEEAVNKEIATAKLDKEKK